MPSQRAHSEISESSVYSLVEKSLETGKDLDELLNEHGLSYEDLKYRTNPLLQLFTPEFKPLSDFKKPFNNIPVVSFFSGCGGLDLGFEAAGFDHLALIEHNELFCDTLRHNRDWDVIGPPYANGDVSNRYEIANTLKEYGIDKHFNGAFIGGPPCQPFSIASNQRFAKNGANFKRVGFDHKTNGNLLFDFVWQIKHFKPKAFLIENVPGLIDLDNGEQVAKVYEDLTASGYTLHMPLKVNAAHYSVPQNRERVFIIGFLGDKHFTPPDKSQEVISCFSAIKGINETYPNHVTRKHKANSIIRYIDLDIGKRDPLGRVDRLDPSLPSKTVIAGGVAGGGRSHLHPFIPRTLSVRECARLQTFPDNFEFTGSSARQFTQVGNAVPPVLAAQLATAIFKSYFEK